MATDPYWGGCPECGGNSGLNRNVGPVQWYCCDRHKTKWQIGENLFSGWRHEGEDRWREAAEYLADYEEVEPLDIWSPLEGTLMEEQVADECDPF